MRSQMGNSMRKFLCTRNRDSADAYVTALLNAGFMETKNPTEADFWLYDYERDHYNKTLNLFKDKPKFIYPHVPYGWWVWDGICAVDDVSCNFVVSEGAKQGMRLYGYPHPIEVCGFPRCELRPFQPTQGMKLLFAPSHTLGKSGKYPTPECVDYHRAAMRHIIALKDHFESVTVRYAYDLTTSGFTEFAHESGITFTRAEALSVSDSLKAIEQADIIISCGTFGYLSLAIGKPTILYGNRTPASRAGKVKHYASYKHLIDFPKPFESLTFDDVANVGLQPDPEVEQWKSLMLGQPFNAEKFISVVREFV